MAKGENLKVKAYNIIKDKIVHCEYVPGQFLIEADLMEVVGASRTPIREALSKLEQEGLIDILPKRGVMVRNISMGEINEIYEVRFLLEPYIIRTYGSQIPTHLLEELLASLCVSEEEARGEQGYNKDQDLHMMLMRISENSYFMEILQRLYSQNHRLRILSGDLLTYRAKETIEEHKAIVQALVDKDYQKAAAAMLVHLENSKEAAVNIMINSKLGASRDSVM